MSERKKIYMIESFIYNDHDYIFCDNHGEVVRCESCKYWNSQMMECSQSIGERNYDDFCSRGVKNELKMS